MNKKNIVIISTFFPPNIHIASNRIYAYAKYLASQHNVTVITLGDTFRQDLVKLPNGDSFNVFYIPNKGFFSSLLFYNSKEHFFTHKLKTLIRVIFNKLNISFYSNWRKVTSDFLRSYLKKNNVDIILSSYAPDDTLHITYKLLKKNKKIKWFIDMRDEYSSEPNLSFLQKIIRKKNEFNYSKKANLIIAVSQPQLKIFKKSMHNVPLFLELRNGFDHQYSPYHKSKEEKLKLGYFGNFYSDRKPDNLFSALLELSFLDDIVIFIATKSANFHIPPKLKKNIVLLPYMSYEDSIQEMAKMDSNILILPNKTQSNGVYSGKIFDYISVQRSILALVNKNDVAATLINNLQCGYLADPDDKNEIKMALSQLYEDWMKQKTKVASINDIQRLHRKYQVEKLLKYIKSSCS